MARSQKILVGVLILLLGCVVYLESQKKPVINWFPSFSSVDKIPYGTFITSTLLEENATTEFNTQPPLYTLKEDTLRSLNYLFINSTINFDDVEEKALLNWVSRGNVAFIAANTHSETLLDTLKISQKRDLEISSISAIPQLALVNPEFSSSNEILLSKNLEVSYFSKIDTLQQTILGIYEINNPPKITDSLKVNFIKAPFGNGTIFLHTQPEIFTNVFLVENNNANYTINTLSYLNLDDPVLWDSYYKNGKQRNSSPLHLILANKNLKWAYYFLLIISVLVIIFKGKRKQRSIPILAENTNKTVSYTQTIAGMYVEKKAHKAICVKLTQLFFEHIRVQYRIPTDTKNSTFIQNVAARSGNSVIETETLFNLISKVEKIEKPTKQDVIQLYKAITAFKNNKSNGNKPT